MGKKKSRSGVLMLEIELAKSVSHDKAVRIGLRWADMASLPLPGDTITVDRVDLEVTKGPASTDVLLDAPDSLTDPVWGCRYDNAEWMSCVALTQMLRHDPGVASIAVVPRDEG